MSIERYSGKTESDTHILVVLIRDPIADIIARPCARISLNTGITASGVYPSTLAGSELLKGLCRCTAHLNRKQCLYPVAVYFRVLHLELVVIIPYSGATVIQISLLELVLPPCIGIWIHEIYKRSLSTPEEIGIWLTFFVLYEVSLSRQLIIKRVCLEYSRLYVHAEMVSSLPE